ncbi:SDR family oxidoreductase [Rufibacter immobilis]|uniref:SDR family oxidoreductase n=1 Tax=Rufibacter immobilis TaxID=1348778 RepID=UPI0035F0AC9A
MEKDAQRPLADKVVVITGASSGIGRATALTFAQQGATLILAARRKEILEQLVADCMQRGSKALAVPTDVTQPQDLLALAEAALAFAGKIDVWVNNAGSGAIGEYEQVPMAAHEQVIQINLLGYMRGAHAVLPIFKRQEYGQLINTISLGAFAPMPYGVSYAASKYGLRGFSEALRAELLKYPKIRISDVFPAFIDTPGFQHGGNYIGKKLKPAPPVYDAQLVADTIVDLVHHYKPGVMAGGFGYVARISNSLFPALTRKLAARFMEKYFAVAEAVPVTHGHLFESSWVGTDVSGGWQEPKKPQVGRIALAVAGAAALLYVVSRNGKSRNA